jgi:hypothetical protein
MILECLNVQLTTGKHIDKLTDISINIDKKKQKYNKLGRTVLDT